MEGELEKPDWIKVRYAKNSAVEAIKKDLEGKGLATVCQESLCPNISECWGGGTATFLLMGDTCTRGCRFCFVTKSGKPPPLNPGEPNKLLESIRRMDVTYAVLTSVDRDDLVDQGSSHLARCISHLKDKMPGLRIEILIPDFRGEKELLRNIVDASPEVIAHNIEVVERLTPDVRDRRAGYRQSLDVLRNVKELDSSIYTKSSIMVGLGETKEEMLQAMDDLRSVGVDFLTIGQYLRPSHRQLAVKEYVPLETFKYYEQVAKEKGFKYVASGPFVRSSYKAGELFEVSV
ncbi:lipoyl synthase [Nanoarchaeota archaeon]